MIIKKYAKCTLVAAAVLAANVSAFAQVKLGNNEELTWEKFADAVNDPSTLETGAITTAKENYNNAVKALEDANKAVTDAQNAYDEGVASLASKTAAMNAYEPKTEEQNREWFTKNWNKFAAFDRAYGNDEDGTGTASEAWYYTKGKTSAPILVISFENPNGAVLDDGKIWIHVTEGEYYKNVEEGATKFKTVQVYLGSTDGTLNYKPTGCLSATVTSNDEILTAISNAFKVASTEKQTTTTGQTADYQKLADAVNAQAAENEDLLKKLNAAKNAVTTANNDVTTTKAALDAAQATVSDALSNVTLTQDIKATTTITAAYSGSINAGNHILTAPANGSLFTRFNGDLSNAAVNGAFATNFSGAHFANVASWNNGAGAYYDEQNTRTAYTDIAEFGYAIRKNYGVDFDGSSIVEKTNNNVVYKLTVTDVNSNLVKYVQYNNGFVIPGSTYTLPANTFAQSATTDIDVHEIANVYYGTNNDCASVVITDGQDFFCPVDVNAASITYTREFKKGMNSVCLPFAVDTNDFTSGVTALSTYDRDADDKFWFNSVAGEVKANTPMLVICGENGGELNMTKTGGVVKKTDASQIAKGATASNGSTSYGTFKRVTADEFEGAFTSTSIWGLKGGAFHPAKVDGSDAATFPAFRMVIKSGTPATQAAPRYVGIVDEFGVDITEELLGSDNNVAAIDGVEAGEAMSIVGGFGVITFTSAEDYGYVNVYSLDGKVAAAAEVVAGTTTVNVTKGLYIVEGQKVLVK